MATETFYFKVKRIEKISLVQFKRKQSAVKAIKLQPVAHEQQACSQSKDAPRHEHGFKLSERQTNAVDLD